MTRPAILIALMSLGACFQSHPSGQRELAGQDCYGCHTADYEATAAPVPVHRDMPQVFSTTCANCHRMSSWKPALEGLHNDLFIVAEGPHAEIACQSCHDLDAALPSKLGANTNCNQCHPDSAPLTAQHVGVFFWVNKPYVYDASVPNFCLDCHPTGIREQHPDDKFGLSGFHKVACGDCHDRTAGPDARGLNVTCVDSKCHHTLAVSDNSDKHDDSDYRKARGNGTDRTFCHDCH